MDIDNSKDLAEKFLISDNRKYSNNIQYTNCMIKPKENNIKNIDKIEIPKIYGEEILSRKSEYVSINEIKNW